MLRYNYKSPNPDKEGWILYEDRLDKKRWLNQEALLCQGNGYLGLRSTFEENYAFQMRGVFLAGLYNQALPEEVTELPNCADVLGMNLTLDGCDFTMQEGKIEHFERMLDMETGEHRRTLLWHSPKGRRYQIAFSRFVSLHNLHLVAQKLVVTALDEDGSCVLETGIDGRITNSGSQHFAEGEKRVFQKSIMAVGYKTTTQGESLQVCCGVKKNNQLLAADFVNKRRSLFGIYALPLKKNQPLSLEKISFFHTSRDPSSRLSLGSALAETLFAEIEDLDYEALLAESKACWQSYWQQADIEVKAEDPTWQVKLRAALYHMRIMTPFQDKRCSIAAKGLSGEGYKGHIFWDTEIFMLPFFLYTFPEEAKNLLLYRYERLAKARDNAKQKGFNGALFPWESAESGAEETPEFAAINIRTGKPTPILSGKKEIHITADIAFSVMAYYQVTLDQAFMLDYGCELVISCAQFWASRMQRTQRGYEIFDVIGPDEYTESINNNYYTNTMAKKTLLAAVFCGELLKQFPEKEQRVQQTSHYQEDIKNFTALAQQLYFPAVREGIIPQDDSFLDKPDLDITPYRAQAGSQGILFDYTREQVIEMQVLKQADVAMLFYLFPDEYSLSCKVKNIDYYEKRTIHDSSLSKCIYAITAMDTGDQDLATPFFADSLSIDFGHKAKSTDGIHAAALFGIWNMVVQGGLGVSLSADGHLKLKNNLPKGFQQVALNLSFQGRQLRIVAEQSGIEVTLLSGDELEVALWRDKGFCLKKVK